MRKLILMILLLLPGLLWAQVYVDIDNSDGPWDGNSWATAFRSVQQGIDAAEDAGGGDVWVAEGTYYIFETDSTTIQLKIGVNLYGGFTGTETALEERNWETNLTSLDGHAPGDTTLQVQHVVTGADSAIIDGFTITGGNAAQFSPEEVPQFGSITPESILAEGGGKNGGGMLIFQCAPTVRNCTFSNNIAEKGGGVYVMVATEFPTENPNPAPDFTNCTFQNNFATKLGGGMANALASTPIFSNCYFTDNTSEGKGGGIYNDFGSSPTFEYCLIANNSAQRAAAIGCENGSSPILTNCTIAMNYAYDMGGGIFTGAYIPAPSEEAHELNLTNCIVWGNINQWGGPTDLVVWHENFFDITYSNVGDGFNHLGEGTIQGDPMFVDELAGDFTLAETSPCINAGDPDSPLDPDGTRADMGVYYFPNINKSLKDAMEAWKTQNLDFDLNADGVVDMKDIQKLISSGSYRMQ